MAVLKRVLVCGFKDVLSTQPNLDKRVRPDGYEQGDLAQHERGVIAFQIACLVHPPAMIQQMIQPFPGDQRAGIGDRVHRLPEQGRNIGMAGQQVGHPGRQIDHVGRRNPRAEQAAHQFDERLQAPIEHGAIQILLAREMVVEGLTSRFVRQTTLRWT